MPADPESNGRVELYCANAGVLIMGDLETSDATWRRAMDVRALKAKRFLARPHPGVKRYFEHKAADHDRWNSAMPRLQRKFPKG